MSTGKILQIIPAQDWYGLFSDEDNGYEFDPLVCFALVEGEEGTTEVRPMNWQGITVDFCDEMDNFISIERMDDLDDEDAEDEQSEEAPSAS